MRSINSITWEAKTADLSGIDRAVNGSIRKLDQPRICYKCGQPALYIMRTYGWKDTEYVAEHQRCYCESCLRETAEEEIRLGKTAFICRTHRAIRSAQSDLEAQGWDMYDSRTRQTWQELGKDLLEGKVKCSSKDEVLAAFLLRYAKEILVHNFLVTLQDTGERGEWDFLLPAKRTIIEIDGDLHQGHGKDDWERDHKLLDRHQNYAILRFRTGYLKRYAKDFAKDVSTLIWISGQIKRECGGVPGDYELQLWKRFCEYIQDHGGHHVERADYIRSFAAAYLEGDPIERPQEPETIEH